MNLFHRGLVKLFRLAVLVLCPALSSPLLEAESRPWNPFEPVTRPPEPETKNAAWVRTPIDTFIAAGHERHDLHPRPEAPPEALLRRVYLDLTGLPPSAQDLQDFLQDSSPQAYEVVVDRLLASPHYGERWGRHWMDIWRYADRDRQQVNDGSEIPEHMWRWRDWIIDSLNADLGYNLMVEHMLAGDELVPGDQGALRATGFLVRNKAKSRDVWLHATVGHTMQAFLGLTLQCARCHDHPVDAITQTEYYQLRAIFEPCSVRLDPVAGSSDTKKDSLPRAYDANANAPTYLYLRGNELTPDKERPIVPGVPALAAGPPFKIESISLPAEGGETGRTSSGRRSALARWMCDRNNPLTARVAVNHIWGRHFGRAIVSSVNDFGGHRQPPSHSALLDWLAADLMEHGWKMKRLHRLIVTSATYRMSSTPVQGSQESDPDNVYLWRFPPRRMEAEVVRDAILSVAGRLDRSLGGPPLEADRGEDELRRSIYFRHGQNTQMPMLRAFDGPVAQECYQRTHSVQPQQALALLNSRLVLQSSRHLARRLNMMASGDADSFIDLAFTNVLSRSCTEEEQKICRAHLREQVEVYNGSEDSKRGTTREIGELSRPSDDPELRARESLVQLLFNHHHFVTIR